ncbi:MAG: hypothetical protein WBB19_18420 [Desulforhopalus sp.]
MIKAMALFCILLVTGLVVQGAEAASGKCTVVKVDGTRMVIECNQQAKGFEKGNQIKIKSDRKKSNQKD